MDCNAPFLDRYSAGSRWDSDRSGLDDGERDAIALAIQLKADLVLMDDREAVHEATRLGLTVTGTLGVLEVAAEKRLVDLPDVLTRLRATNFRASNALFDSLLKRHAEQQ
jgi:predicted nucleic acid-binding protein